MNKSIVVLENLLRDSPDLGNKVKNTAILLKEGIRVPLSIGLKYDMYTEQMKDLLPEIKEVIMQNSDYSIIANKIKNIILKSDFKFSNDVMFVISEYMPKAKYFAVRSSGAPVVLGKEIAEDSSGVSLAGQYESYLMVPIEHIPEAILLCYASLFSERVLRAFDVKNDFSYLNSRMSVLIQEMFPSDLSAVVMTNDPVEEEDVFGIEITYGACEALVSGKVQGDLYLLNRNNGEIIDVQKGAKTCYIEYQPFSNASNSNEQIFETPISKREQLSATPEVIARIFNIGMQIEYIFGMPQDIELVVFDNEIGIVQSRPITTNN